MTPITLPQEHYDMCKKAIAMADEIIPFAEQCLECDIPVQPYIDAIRAARDSAAKQLAVFHPDK